MSENRRSDRARTILLDPSRKIEDMIAALEQLESNPINRIAVRGLDFKEWKSALKSIEESLPSIIAEATKVCDQKADIEAKYEQLKSCVSKVKKDADDDANRIRDEAQRKAEVIQESAKTEAEAIRKQAEENAKALIEEAEQQKQQIIADGHRQVEEMITSHDVYTEATKRARDMIETAQSDIDNAYQALSEHIQQIFSVLEGSLQQRLSDVRKSKTDILNLIDTTEK